VARVTENPKFIGGAILFSLGLGAYLHGPEFFRQISAPPPKPAPPPKLAEAGTDEMKFYRMMPNKLPDKWPQLLVSTNVPAAIFDEVPKSEGVRQETVLPAMTPGWHLSSTYIAPDERVAVVSGVMVREGDFLGPFTVKKIEEDKVVFSHPLGERQMVVGQYVGVPKETAKKTKSKSPPTVRKGEKGETNAPSQDPNVLVKALEGLDKWRDMKSDGKEPETPGSPNP